MPQLQPHATFTKELLDFPRVITKPFAKHFHGKHFSVFFRAINAGKGSCTNQVLDFVLTVKVPVTIPFEDLFGLQGGYHAVPLKRLDDVLHAVVTHPQVIEGMVHLLALGKPQIGDPSSKVLGGQVRHGRGGMRKRVGDSRRKAMASQGV